MSINKVIVLGHVGQIKVSNTGSGDKVFSTSIAHNVRYKKRDTGELIESTTWVDVVAFGKTANTLAEYVSKGDKLYIEGEITKDKWTDNNGSERISQKVRINSFEFCGRSNREATTERQDPATQKPEEEDLNDDIPF